VPCSASGATNAFKLLNNHCIAVKLWPLLLSATSVVGLMAPDLFQRRLVS
jgi:hypothetical protein